MPDFATLYLRTLPTEIWINQYPGIQRVAILLSKGASPVRYEIEAFAVSLTMNAMSEGEIPQHLAGFSNYAFSLHDSGKSQNTKNVLEKIAQTKVVLGCVVDPSFDTEGLIGGFLSSWAIAQDGLLFARDQIFGNNGEVLLS